MRTAQASLSAGAMRALVLGSTLGLAALTAALYLAAPAEAARPAMVRDSCTQTSGDDHGIECPSSTDILIRTKNSDGTCGDWICCPSNGNGTYNCERGTSPSQLVNDPGRRPKRGRLPIAPRPQTISPN